MSEKEIKHHILEVIKKEFITKDHGEKLLRHQEKIDDLLLGNEYNKKGFIDEVKEHMAAMMMLYESTSKLVDENTRNIDKLHELTAKNLVDTSKNDAELKVIKGRVFKFGAIIAAANALIIMAFKFKIFGK